MSDTVASLGIKVTTEGVTKADTELKKLATASEKSEKAIEKMIATIKKQNMILQSGRAAYTDFALGTLGASKAEKQLAQNIESSIAAYRNNIKATKDLVTEERKRQSSIDGLIAKAKDQLAAVSKSKDQMMEYKLALLGASDAEKKAVSQINSRIAAIKASKQAEEEANRMAKESQLAKERIISSEQKRRDSINSTIMKLRDEAAAAGKSEVQLLKYKLSLLGATEAEKKEALALQKTVNEFKRANSAANVYGDAMSRMKTIIGSLVGAVGLVEIIKIADNWSLVSSRLKLVTSGTEELARAEGKLFEIAQSTRQSYEQTGDLYSRVARSTKELNLSQDQLLGITDTINKSLIISGSSTQAAEAAIIQLGQGFASGALRGQELNSVLEQAPRLAEAIAQSMGVAVGSLKDIAATGGITSKVLVDALSKTSDSGQKISAEFSQMNTTVGQSVVQIKNAFAKLVGEFDNMSGSTKLIASGFTLISEHMRDIADVAVIAAISSIPIIIMNINKSVQALTVTMSLNPWVAAATAILAVSSSLVMFADEADAAASGKSLGELSSDLQNLEISLENLHLIDKDPIMGGAENDRQIADTEAAIRSLKKEIQSLTGVATVITDINRAALDTIHTFEKKQEFELFKGIEKKYDNVLKTEVKYLESSLAQYKASESAKPEIVRAMEEEIAAKREAARNKEAAAYKRSHASENAARNKAMREQESAEKKVMAERESALKKIQAIEDARQGRVDKIIEKLKEEIATYKEGEEATVLYQLTQEKADSTEKALAASLGATIDQLKEKTKAQDEYNKAMEKTAPDKIELNREKAILAVNEAMAKGAIQSAVYSASISQVNTYFDKIEETAADKKLNDIGKELDELTSFDGSSFGNTIADGINNAMISMQKLGKTYEDNEQIQQKIIDLQKELATGEGSPEQRKKSLEDIDKYESAMIKNQISSYRELFGTTSQLFEENTKERKAMHNLEMAFAAAEIAINLQKAVGEAVTAIAHQASGGDVYSAFARVAAMAVTMGALISQIGGSISGGSTDAEIVKATNVTGSVLGNSTAESESLKNIEEFWEDMHLEDYAELKGIHDEMKDLNSNITGLVSTLFRGGAGGFTAADMGINTDWVMGDIEEGFRGLLESATTGFLTSIFGFKDAIFGGIADWANNALGNIAGKIFGGGSETSVLAQGITTTDAVKIGELIGGSLIDTIKFADIKTETEGGWFHSDKTELSTRTEDLGAEVDNLFTQIFKNLGNTFVSIAEIVGQDVQTVQDFAFSIGKIDLKNLETSDEINEALNAALSSITDQAATALFGELVGQYQTVGEGMLETAVRVASEKIIVMDTLDKLGNAFKDADIPSEAIAFSQGLLDIAGGLETFSEYASNYYDSFFSDEEKQVDIGELLTESLKDFEIDLPNTREMYRDVVDGLDLTTESGKKAYISMLKMSESADEYYAYLEDANEDTREAMEKLTNTITDGVNNILIASKRITEQELFKTTFANKYGVSPGEQHSTEAVSFISTASTDTIQALADSFGVTVSGMLQDIADEANMVASEISIAKEKAETIVNGINNILMASSKLTNEDLFNTNFKDKYDVTPSASHSAEAVDFISTASPETIQALADGFGVTVSEMLQDIADEATMVAKVAESKKSLEIRIMELSDDAAGALIETRKLEIDSLDASLKPLQEIIWNLEDESKIVEKAKELLNNKLSLENQLYTLLGDEVSLNKVIAQQRDITLAAMDISLRDTQKKIWLIEEENTARQKASELLNNKLNLDSQLYTLLGDEISLNKVIAQQRSLELLAMDQTLRATQERVWALEDEKVATDVAKDALEKSIESQISMYQSLADAAEEYLNKSKDLLDRSFDAEQTNLTANHEAMVNKLTVSMEEATKTTETLESAFESIKSARESMETDSAALTFEAVTIQLKNAISAAKSGDFSQTETVVPNLGILTSQTQSDYASSVDYKRDSIKTYLAISQLEDLTGSQLTEQQQIVKNLEDQITIENKHHEIILENMQAQYDLVVGVDKSVISFEQAVTEYQKAQYASDGANTLLQTQTVQLEAQLNSLLNINNGVLSVANAVNNLSSAQWAFNSSLSGMLLPVSGSVSQDSGLGFADGGILSGPSSGYSVNATFHGPEAIVPLDQLNTSSLISEIRKLREEVSSLRAESARANFQIAKNTQETTKTLRKFDYDGMPEQRTA